MSNRDNNFGGWGRKIAILAGIGVGVAVVGAAVVAGTMLAQNLHEQQYRNRYEMIRPKVSNRLIDSDSDTEDIDDIKISYKESDEEFFDAMEYSDQSQMKPEEFVTLNSNIFESSDDDDVNICHQPNLPQKSNLTNNLNNKRVQISKSIEPNISNIENDLRTNLNISDSLIIRERRIIVVNNDDDFRNAANLINWDIAEYGLLSITCKRNRTSPNNNKIALLQYASKNFCILIRLCKIPNIKKMSKEFKSWGRNGSLVKVGLDMQDDIQDLLNDYQLKVTGTLDIRHLALQYGKRQYSLKAMSKEYLKLSLNNKYNFWEQATLIDEMIKCAALEAIAIYELFEHFHMELGKNDDFKNKTVLYKHLINKKCNPNKKKIDF